MISQSTGMKTSAYKLSSTSCKLLICKVNLGTMALALRPVQNLSFFQGEPSRSPISEAIGFDYNQDSTQLLFTLIIIPHTNRLENSRP
jgi:hypothetical protein